MGTGQAKKLLEHSCSLLWDWFWSKTSMRGLVGHGQVTLTLGGLPIARQFPCNEGRMVTGQTTGTKAICQAWKKRERKSHESHSVKRNTTPSSETTLFRIFRIFFFFCSEEKPLRYAIPFTWVLWRWPSFKNHFLLNGPNLLNII